MLLKIINKETRNYLSDSKLEAEELRKNNKLINNEILKEIRIKLSK